MDSSYAPRSPDLSGLGRPPPPQPTTSDPFAKPFGDNHVYAYGSNNSNNNNINDNTHYYQPTSAPPLSPYDQPYHTRQPHLMPAAIKDEGEWLPDAPAPARRGRKAQPKKDAANGYGADLAANGFKSEQDRDPTHGVVLRTQFPVARIKRIMQADEDVGKVAQVTPHVVSRALELFMTEIITASAEQALASGGVGGKGQKRILPQHMKKAITATEQFDFLHEIAGKVPEAPVKGKKECAGSDSEDGKPKRRSGKKRKDSGDGV